MKAAVHTRYGGPEVLTIKEIPMLNCNDNQILIQVKNASVNALDWRLLRAKPFFLRLMSGVFKPKHTIRGADISGEVVKVGKNITKFKIGDEVVGDVSHGSFAQYVLADENQIIIKPKSMTHIVAASLPVAAVTALQAIQKAQIKKGEKVLIHGGSGGVGNFAIQIARANGAEVSTVVSTKHIDVALQSGASVVYDYTKEDITKLAETFDVIIDIAATQKLPKMISLLNKQGRYVMVGFTLKLMLELLVKKSFLQRKKEITIDIVSATVNPKDLQTVVELTQDKKITPYIDTHFSLDEIEQAIEYMENTHPKGKILIDI